MNGVGLLGLWRLLVVFFVVTFLFSATVRADNQTRSPGGKGPAGPAGPAGAAGAAGTFDATTTFWSSIDMWKLCVDASGNPQPPAAGTGGEKDGQRFYFTKPPTGKIIKVTGVRFYWNGPNVTFGTFLYNAHSGTLIKSADVTTSGTNSYESVFSPAVTITPYVHYTAAISERTGNNNVQPCIPNGANAANNGLPLVPFLVAAYRVVTNHYYCGGACVNSDASGPTSQLGTDKVFPIEPVWVVQ